jgi:hypothetical protein
MEKKKKWDISLKKESFEKYRKDPGFALLLTLARVVNSLYFCQVPAVNLDINDNSPSAHRQRINSFFFTCGVLYEGLKVANSVGEYFGRSKSFKELFIPLLKDKKTKRIEKDVLSRFRNKIVFHFDKDVAPNILDILDFETYIFAAASGDRNGDVYYGLADEIAINYMIGNQESEEKERSIARIIMTEVTEVAISFIDAAEKLFAEVLRDMGWEVNDRSNFA